MLISLEKVTFSFAQSPHPVRRERSGFANLRNSSWTLIWIKGVRFDGRSWGRQTILDHQILSMHPPLANFDTDNLLLTRPIGRRLNQHEELTRRVTVTAAGTKRACQYLASKGKRIVIMEFGNGKIGVGCGIDEFGTAGIVRGQTVYDYEATYQ
jgi:hypothetical protein